MRGRGYWKDHYVLETDAEEIEKHLQVMTFASGGWDFELIYFESDKDAPNILVSQGSGGHAYVFVQLGYRMHQRGYNVLIMPKHCDGFTIDGLVERHWGAARHLIDPEDGARQLETCLVEGYLRDPDFDKKYELSSVMSQLTIPPPNPIAELRTPTMFMVATRGVLPTFTRTCMGAFPINRRMVEVDGSVYWMLFDPQDAGRLLGGWFDETL